MGKIKTTKPTAFEALYCLSKSGKYMMREFVDSATLERIHAFC